MPVDPGRITHEPEDPEESKVVEVHGDDIDEGGLRGGETINVVCEQEHCATHEGDGWDIPKDWDLANTVYSNVGTKDRLVRFMEGESMGDEVQYRCPACRNCWSCKQGDKLEAVSLQEEREQFLVQSSVRYCTEEKKLIARLPFIADPVENLKPNQHVAKKVFTTQLRKAQQDEGVRMGIVASHKKLADKGYVVRVSDLNPKVRELVEAMTGYTIPWRTVVKASSLSTPVRMVFDASSRTPGGDSLNNILAKGANSLGDLFSILMKFRMRKKGMSADVSMAYNGVKMDDRDIAFQKFYWKDGMLEASPLELWVVLTLIYGIKPAGNQTTRGFNILGEVAAGDSELEVDLGVEALVEKAYMDDVCAGHDSVEDCLVCAKQLREVLALGGMSVKDVTISGKAPSDLVSSDGVHVGLLGMLWDSHADKIMLDIGDLYIGKKVRGKVPEIVEGEGDLREKLKGRFTRRTLVSKVASIYDPLGLLVPVTAKFKLMLHDVCKLGLDWDDTIAPEYFDVWVKNIEEMQTLGNIKFNRSIIPEDAEDLNVSYVVSCDASQEIAIACVHSRVKVKGGGYHVQVLVAKSKIVRNLTVPRAELRGAVLAASLGFHVDRNGGDRVEDIMYVTDSSIVLYWLSLDQRPLQTGVRNAVLEIRRLSEAASWFHIPTEHNVADLGTRSEVPVDMTTTSDWITGKSWMGEDRVDMPIKTVAQITLNSEQKIAASLELRARDVMGIHTNSLVDKVGTRYSFSNYVVDPNRNSWPKSVRIMGMVLAFVDRLRRREWVKDWFPKKDDGKRLRDFSHSSEYNLTRATNYFFFKATREVKQFAKKKDWEGCELREGKILYYDSRVIEGQEVENKLGPGLDVQPLMYVKPLVDRYSPVAYSIMSYAHIVLARHRNSAETLRESRGLAYVLGGRDLASEIRDACPFCRRYKASLLKRAMGKLHPNRFVIAPAFYTAQCDLFGPINATCEHNHRSTVKCWGLVFKCPSTAATAVYCLAGYDTASFMQAYTRHASRYGHPHSLVIDAGSQLIKGCKEMNHALLDVEEMTTVLHQVGGRFEVVPVGSHNQNGMVERGIKEIKALFLQMYRGLKLDILSLETAFTWISNELNNFPQCIGSRTSDLNSLDIITPARLIVGRNNRRCLSGPVTVDMPSRLIRQMKETEEAWWKVWTVQKLVEMVPKPRKWAESSGVVGVGDVVLMLRKPKDMAVGEPVWKIGRVVGLAQGRDGEARQLTVEYKNSTEQVFRQVTVGARQVAVLHHEGDLELVDALNSAAAKNNLCYQICEKNFVIKPSYHCAKAQFGSV